MQADTTTVDAVTGTLNYVRPGTEPLFAYAYAPPPGMPERNGEPDPHAVTIRDARALASELSLDREGFLLRRHATAVTDFYDERQVTDIYYPEMATLVRDVTGAEAVVVFDHIVRNAGRAGAKSPAMAVHNDYTLRSAPQRLRDLLPAGEAEARLQRRFAIINVWRPIRGPLLRSPLALCDARTLREEDLIPTERRYPHRSGETASVRFSPRHRWFYFPRLRTDEALFIKCHDSAADARARVSAHSAFDDPTTPPEAPPRESIEVRTFAFF